MLTELDSEADALRQELVTLCRKPLKSLTY